MKPTPLCTHCSEIPFDALYCPLGRDIEALKEGKTDTCSRYFKNLNNTRVHTRVCLGKLTRIVESSQQCRLCYLILNVLSRWRGFHFSQLPIEDRSSTCWAAVGYYGLFWGPPD